MSRLLTFGDLHCDRSHLRGLIERAVEERCDALVSLGDLCYLPREPEGRRFLRSAGALLPQASTTTKRFLPTGALVRLTVEPATDRVDDYGRLLRYVVRAEDGVNVNVRLVDVAAAAPYFYRGRRGRYANRLETLAKRARAKHAGLWGACPGSTYNPYRSRHSPLARGSDSQFPRSRVGAGAYSRAHPR